MLEEAGRYDGSRKVQPLRRYVSCPSGGGRGDRGQKVHLVKEGATGQEGATSQEKREQGGRCDQRRKVRSKEEGAIGGGRHNPRQSATRKARL